MSSIIAFLTLADRTGFFVYDHLAFEPLERLGWTAQEIPWDQPDVPWQDFAAVVIRSTWDYQQRPTEFLRVLDTITATGTRLFNSVSLVRWNIEKSYLKYLEQKGIDIVPTMWRDELSPNETAIPFFEALNTNQLVVKPLVGANADDTFRILVDDDDAWQNVKRVFRSKTCLLQPFIPSIATVGEYSLFYFGGEYSHCVLKKPKTGDFRVQEEHGGSISSCEPPAELCEISDRVISAIPEQPLYARVDLVQSPNESWFVMEVELIEPSLYFPYDEKSPERFAQSLNRMLRS